MNKLREGASKAEELAHWQEFVEALPDCTYLRTYLEGAAELIRQGMAVDMVISPLATLRQERDQLQCDIELAQTKQRTLATQGEALKGQLSNYRRGIEHLRDELKDMATAMQTLASQTYAAHRQVGKAVTDSYDRV